MRRAIESGERSESEEPESEEEEEEEEADEEADESYLPIRVSAAAVCVMLLPACLPIDVGACGCA